MFKNARKNVPFNFKQPCDKSTNLFSLDLVTGGELFDDIERRQCYSEKDAATRSL